MFVRFILGELPAGLRGLALSGVFAAAMSTLSSRINAAASLTLVDVVQRLIPEKLKGREIPLARWITFGWAHHRNAGCPARYSLGRYYQGRHAAREPIGRPAAQYFSVGDLQPPGSRDRDVSRLLCGPWAVGLVAAFTDVSWGWYTLIGSLAAVLSGYLLSCWLPPSGKTGAEKSFQQGNDSSFGERRWNTMARVPHNPLSERGSVDFGSFP